MSATSPAQKPSVKVKALWVGVRYAGSGFEKRPGTWVQLGERERDSS